jgi:tetratricopeptide (TPR) repeat protein
MRFGLNIVDDKGIKKTWNRKHVIYWKDVAYIETESHSYFDNGYRTTIYTQNNKFSFGCLKGGFGGPDTGVSEIYRYYALLAKIIHLCPSAISNDKTDFILKWGKKLGNFQNILRQYEQNHSDINVTIQLACLYILFVNNRKAKKLLKKVIKSEPKNLSALELLAIVETDRNVTVFSKGAEAYEELVALFPDNPQFLSLAICSDVNPVSHKEYIDKLFKISKKNFTARFAIIKHYLWKRDFPEAKEQIKKLKQEYNEDPKKNAVGKILDFNIKYRTDIDFRNRINRKRDFSILLWGGSVILSVLLMFFWVKYASFPFFLYFCIGNGILAFVILLLLKGRGLLF